MADTHMFVVLTNPVDGREDEYHDWYTNIHIPDVLKLPGAVAAQRFRLAHVQRYDTASPYAYLALYEVRSDLVEDFVATLRERSGTEVMPVSDALGDAKFSFIFEPMTPRQQPA